MFYNLWLKSSNELFQRWRHFLRKSCGFGHGRALSLLLLKRERRLLDLLFRLVSMVITDSLSRLFELVFEPRRFSLFSFDTCLSFFFRFSFDQRPFSSSRLFSNNRLALPLSSCRLLRSSTSFWPFALTFSL